MRRFITIVAAYTVVVRDIVGFSSFLPLLSRFFLSFLFFLPPHILFIFFFFFSFHSMACYFFLPPLPFFSLLLLFLFLFRLSTWGDEAKVSLNGHKWWYVVSDHRGDGEDIWVGWEECCSEECEWKEYSWIGSTCFSFLSFLFLFFFFFYNDIESIVSFSFLREWTGRGISLGRRELIRLLIGYILERLEEFLLDIFLFNYWIVYIFFKKREREIGRDSMKVFIEKISLWKNL